MASFYESIREALENAPTKSNIQKKRTEKTSRENPPLAPSFTYKDPAVDNNISYWRMFADKGTMRHYDDLMGILDDIEKMDSKDDVINYVDQLKGTVMYKVNPGVQDWLGDLESYYYGPSKYDASYPIELMRNQTMKAKEAFENGFVSNHYTTKKNVPAPSGLLQEIRSTYRK